MLSRRVNETLEVDKGKLTALANLKKLTFRALALRRSKVRSDLPPLYKQLLSFLCKNVVFSGQAEYSYFSAEFRLKIFLHYS